MVKALFRLNALQTRDTFDEFWCFLYCAIAVAWPSLVGIIMLTITLVIMPWMISSTKRLSALSTQISTSLGKDGISK